MEPIDRGNDPRGLLLALAFLGGGLVVAALAALTDFTLRLGSLVLPQWTLYLVAFGLAATAAFTLFISLGVERCASCKTPLVNHDAYFALESVPSVVWAVEHLDPAPLEQLAPVPKNQMKAVASISYCEKCRAVGSVKASKWQEHQHHELGQARTMTGQVVARFAALAEKHLAFRGEDDDE
jgi:hypothetical protein